MIARTLEVSRSNLYEEETPMRTITKEDDLWLLPMIRSITDERPTYGYRRVTAILNSRLQKMDKSRVNPKRVYRIMRANQLLLQRYGKRPARVHDGKIAVLSSNIRWCSDGFGIQCWNGEQVQVAFSLDCCDREVITWAASTRGIDGELMRDIIAESVEARFGAVQRLPHSIQWMTDNGSANVARETVFYARELGFEVCTTAPYSPESNGMAEAFVKTFKRDWVHVADLKSAARVLEQLPGWFEDYNNNHPHKALKMKSPREYRRQQQVS